MSNLFPTNGRHARTRKHPGIKGKRPDRKEARRMAAIERAPHGKAHLYMNLDERIRWHASGGAKVA
jgi:hypothetical protein